MTELKFGLKETAIKRICGVFARYPQIEKAVIYGSRAEGNYKNDSDIDLSLHGGEDLTLNILPQIRAEVNNLLIPYTINLAIFVDLSSLDFVGPLKRVEFTFYERIIVDLHFTIDN